MSPEHQDTLVVSKEKDPAFRFILFSIVLIIVIYSGQRIWIMARTEVIAKDGALYLEMAQKWDSDPDGAMEKYVRDKSGVYPHPGYPLMVKTVHGLLFSGSGNDLAGWERAGQTVSFTTGLAAVIGIWFLAGLLFRNWTAALIGALIVSAGKKFAGIGADVLSDMPTLCFEVWSLAVSVLACRAIIRKQWKAVAWAALAGLLAALGFLVRPEALVVLPATGLTWLIIQCRQRGSWIIFAACSVVIVAVSALGIAPYVIVAGRLTSKVISSGGSSSLILAYTQYPVDVSAPMRLLGRFYEAQHPIAATLSLGWVVVLSLARFIKKMPLRDQLVYCTETGTAIMALICLQVSFLVMHHYTKTGAMSHRYLLLPSAVLAGAVGAAVVSLSQLAIAVVELKKPAPGKKLLVPGFATVLMLLLLIHARDPLHEKDIFVKEAGLWIAGQATVKDRLLTDNTLVCHYSRIPRPRSKLIISWHISQLLDRGETLETIYGNMINKLGPRFKFVTFSHRDLETCQSMEKVFLDNGFVKAKTFSRLEDGKIKEQMLVFRRGG